MPENRNNSCGLNFDGRGTVCIDTRRVLDCCRDRDCFEDVRVFLTPSGQSILDSATSVRTRSARIIWTYVGVNEVPFNCGFYQITIRFYIDVEVEACLGIGKSETFNGVAAIEKTVILYGGSGNATTYSSGPDNNFCSVPNTDNVSTNDPVALVETVDPIVLGTRIVDCSCPCGASDYAEIPPVVSDRFGMQLQQTNDGLRLYISFGIFSVVRIERPAQLLVQATDYSVPDKECVVTEEDNPCDVFRTMPFPVSRFKGSCCNDHQDNRPQQKPGCGCGR